MGYDISYDDLVGWEADLRLLTERVAGSLFTRPEPRATFADLVRGLLADVPRKNSWQLAEHVGHGSAHRLEWLLGGAKWDADALRDRVRDYASGTAAAPAAPDIAGSRASPWQDPAPTDLGRTPQRVRGGSLKPLVRHYGRVLEPDRYFPQRSICSSGS